MTDRQGRLPRGGDPELGLEGQLGGDEGGESVPDQRAARLAQRHAKAQPSRAQEELSLQGAGDSLTYRSSYYKASP